MATYQAFISLADKLIRQKGAAIALTRESESSPDPVTQTAVRASTAYTFRGVAFPAGKGAEFRVGSLERRNVLEVYLAQKDQSVEPRAGDKIAWKGEDWTILWAHTYDPAADGAIFTKAYVER